MRAAALQFFGRDMDAKLQHCHGPYGCAAGGYTAQGVEGWRYR